MTLSPAQQFDKSLRKTADDSTAFAIVRQDFIRLLANEVTKEYGYSIEISAGAASDYFDEFVSHLPEVASKATGRHVESLTYAAAAQLIKMPAVFNEMADGFISAAKKASAGSRYDPLNDIVTRSGGRIAPG